MGAGPRQVKTIRLAGLVLAGGRSRRFGSEKAVASLGGRPMLTWSLGALEGVCETVAVSAAADSAAAAVANSRGLPVLADDPAHSPGPLSGLAAGLPWATALGFDALITLPCDTPLVGPVQVETMIAALGDAPAAYALCPEGPQALCAVWRTRLAGGLAAALAGGEHPPVRDFLAAIGARPVAFVDARPFANVNRPEALARLAAAVARRSPNRLPRS
ncbi:MAG: molybdenum cofactor guanylyltransferase [Caulobacteraceae bacterium]